MMGEKKPGYRAALELGLYLAGATILGFSGCAYKHPQIQETRPFQMDVRKELDTYRQMWDKQKEQGLSSGNCPNR